MAQTEYTQNSGQLPGNEPEGAEPTVFTHGFYGAPTAYNVSDERSIGAIGPSQYEPDNLRNAEDDAGGQVPNPNNPGSNVGR